MLTLLLATAVLAADGPAADHPAPTSPPVALVNGVPITLREVEDALLVKEGKEAVQRWVDRHLERLEWDRLHDDDPVLTIGFNKITRADLAKALMAHGAGDVRDDLVNIAIVDQALAKAGIIVTATQIRATWERMARKFQEDMAKKGTAGVDLANWIQTQKGMSIATFQAQAGFRKLAGLQALVHQRAADEFDEPTLRAAFAGRPERYREPEAVDLHAIFIPYRGSDGAPVAAAEQERLLGVMSSLHRQIAQDPASFATVFEHFGKSWDAGAGPGGHLGWIPRDGKRLDGHPLADEVMRAAWDVKTFPALLAPIAHARGVSIVQVVAHRPQRDPDFAQVRQRVLDDLIDETLDRRTEVLLRELNDRAKIEYRSLPEAKAQR